jgi:hypothetical protein
VNFGATVPFFDISIGNHFMPSRCLSHFYNLGIKIGVQKFPLKRSYRALHLLSILSSIVRKKGTDPFRMYLNACMKVSAAIAKLSVS